jgi:hypothetical protein
MGFICAGTTSANPLVLRIHHHIPVILLLFAAHAWRTRNTRIQARSCNRTR